ncbi:hypothetical protein JHK86_011874 [Glycine max]|nr:hypothetical protein JHK86_011874 [Glycine max]
MAPLRPFKTEKPVTLAKLNPSAPPAKFSSPRWPRKAVVMAVLANLAKFIWPQVEGLSLVELLALLVPSL